MRSVYHIFVALQYFFLKEILAYQFKENTNDPIITGIIAAFGYFNSDAYTDVFTLQRGYILQVLLGSENGQFQPEPHINCSFGRVITSVVPGDFNGDNFMDILVTLSHENDINDVMVLWGNNNSVDCKAHLLFSLTSQPVIADFNGDMIPDIIGEVGVGQRYAWISSFDKSFKNHSIKSDQNFRKPHSSGLGDFNNDLASDILITGEDYMELWYNTGTGYIRNGSLPYPKVSWLQHIFPQQSTFVDINLDGVLDHIMPVCYDSNCLTSAIYIRSSNALEWRILFDDFNYGESYWHFRKPTGSPLEIAALPVTLRAGDIDMDGYPDFITVLQSKSNPSINKAVIFNNIQCSNCSDCTHERCLKIDWEVAGLKDIVDIQIATFFDISEDGIMDVVASSKTKGDWKIHALKNIEPSESCFMKVLVHSGLPLLDTKTETPYGVNQPGPMVRYNLTKEDGERVVGCSIQMSQSAHFPLQLPYSIFGLGQTPNFIDALTVAIPAKFKKNVHKKEWNQIIPNSQIIVIPNPPQDEEKWVRKLFVTPSKFVIYTCIALTGTCIFISLIVALLHWKERKEDKKEKMQDAYRFHFDAM
ncbi:T-cell immunomodulatory protein-like [Uloborus diversus]|uniref:T-cell immunomodulatory protein-like n=1 Tax=Uloborus diversus TaxID=327109 RepID=UPI002409ACB4|nr:T-cell immunomodulatory protein-like [Uloborus diversus]